MEGFAGFVGLMFGLVVLSVIITLVVCAVKRASQGVASGRTA